MAGRLFGLPRATMPSDPVWGAEKESAAAAAAGATTATTVMEHSHGEWLSIYSISQCEWDGFLGRNW